MKSVEEYSDGSRAEGLSPGTVVAAAVTRLMRYLGRYATVMDAEEAGVALAWSGASVVAFFF